MKRLLIGTIFLPLLLWGCSNASNSDGYEHSSSEVAVASAEYDGADVAQSSPISQTDSTVRPTKKWIAERFFLEIEVPAEKLETAWTDFQQKCQALKCQIIESRIGSTQNPAGSITFRIDPAAQPQLFAHISKNFTILSQTQTSEDKTIQVIDTEARLQNRIELRNRLRNMLSSQKASLQEIFEIETTLNNIQAEIDSYSSQKAILQLETETQWVQLNFYTEKRFAERESLSPISNAWHEITYTISSSTAALLLFLASLLPWIPLILLIIWGIRKFRRRNKK